MVVMRNIILLFAIFLLPFSVMAQGDIIEQSLELINAFKVGSVGVILSAVYQFLKSPSMAGLLSRLNPNVHPWLILILGNAVMVIESLANSGQPIWVALVEGSVIGAVAMGVHDTARTMKKKKEE
jgi:hypothetical protein